MTSAVGILNIPSDILNISPTSSTSPRCASRLPAATAPGMGLEDVEDVEPKKNFRSTYLLSVVTRGSSLLRAVKAADAPVPTRTYLVLNILNIPKTWHATSPSVPVARVLDDRRDPLLMSASKRKGTAWESAIVGYLLANGVPHAERRTLAGSKDRGDIAGIPGVVIEAKSATRIDLAGWLDETETERRNDRASVGAAWVKRRGKASPGHGYVVMTGERFLRLLADAGYVPQPPVNDITPADTTGEDHR